MSSKIAFNDFFPIQTANVVYFQKKKKSNYLDFLHIRIISRPN